MRLLFLVDICMLRGKESCWELAKPVGAICSAPWLQARLWQSVKRKGMHAVIWRSSDRRATSCLSLPPSMSPVVCMDPFGWGSRNGPWLCSRVTIGSRALSKGVGVIKSRITTVKFTGIKLAMLNRTFSSCWIQRGTTVRASVAATEREAVINPAL